MEKDLLLKVLLRTAKKYQLTYIIKPTLIEFNNKIFQNIHLYQILLYLKSNIRKINPSICLYNFFNDIENILNEIVRKKVFEYLSKYDILKKCLQYHIKNYTTYAQLAKTITIINGASFLFTAFTWTETTEGYTFWKQHYDNLWSIITINM